MVRYAYGMHVKTGLQETGSGRRKIVRFLNVSLSFAFFIQQNITTIDKETARLFKCTQFKKCLRNWTNNLLVVIPPLARLGELVRNLSNFFNSPLFLPIRISIWRRTCARYASCSLCRARRCCHLVLDMRGMTITWKLVKQYGYGISFEHYMIACQKPVKNDNWFTSINGSASRIVKA